MGQECRNRGRTPSRWLINEEIPITRSAPASFAPRSVRVKSKKGAPRALQYDAHPQAHDVVDAGAFTSDGGFHGRVQSVVGNRKHWSWLAIGGRSHRILAGKGPNRLVRAAPG